MQQNNRPGFNGKWKCAEPIIKKYIINKVVIILPNMSNQRQTVVVRKKKYKGKCYQEVAIPFMADRSHHIADVYFGLHTNAECQQR